MMEDVNHTISEYQPDHFRTAQAAAINPPSKCQVATDHDVTGHAMTSYPGDLGTCELQLCGSSAWVLWSLRLNSQQTHAILTGNRMLLDPTRP